MARTDGGGADADGDTRHQETNDYTQTTHLPTVNQERAAPLPLGHWRSHDDDERRTADGGYGATRDLGGEEEDGDVLEVHLLTLSASEGSTGTKEVGGGGNQARQPTDGGGEDGDELAGEGFPARILGLGGRGGPGAAFAPARSAPGGPCRRRRAAAHS